MFIVGGLFPDTPLNIMRIIIVVAESERQSRLTLPFSFHPDLSSSGLLPKFSYSCHPDKPEAKKEQGSRFGRWNRSALVCDEGLALLSKE